MYHNAKGRQIVIQKVEMETADSKRFYFSYLDKMQFDYIPGQFITLLFESQSKTEVRRSYSLFTNPDLDALPGFLVKRKENGAISRFILDNIMVGSVISIQEATGNFSYHKNDFQLFIAAGSGITAIYPILRQALRNNENTYLIYSNFSRIDTIFFKEIEGFKLEYLNLKVEYIFTREDIQRRLNNLNLEEILFREYKNIDKSNISTYLCTPLALMRTAQFVLRVLDFYQDLIFKENFVIPEMDDLYFHFPKYEGFRNVSLTLGEKKYFYKIAQGEDLLNAGLKQGIPMPYSCKSGICGACAMTCTSVMVEMSQNEVLTEKDLKRNRILTCTGYPLGDMIVLEK